LSGPGAGGGVVPAAAEADQAGPGVFEQRDRVAESMPMDYRDSHHFLRRHHYTLETNRLSAKPLSYNPDYQSSGTCQRYDSIGDQASPRYGAVPVDAGQQYGSENSHPGNSANQEHQP
jgi:hypothetical protein